MPVCYFVFILLERGGALTGLKYFWSTNNSFWILLSIQNVNHVTNSAVFSGRSAAANSVRQSTHNGALKHF